MSWNKQDLIGRIVDRTVAVGSLPIPNLERLTVRQLRALEDALLCERVYGEPVDEDERRLAADVKRLEEQS